MQVECVRLTAVLGGIVFRNAGMFLRSLPTTSSFGWSYNMIVFLRLLTVRDGGVAIADALLAPSQFSPLCVHVLKAFQFDYEFEISI